MTSYPESLQDLDATRGSASDKLSSPSHVDQHTLEDATIEALQTKVGIDSSADTTSIDYKLKNTSSIDPGHKHTNASVTLALDDLSDVDAASPSDGDFLSWNNTDSAWEPASTTAPDASTTVKGVVKVDTAPSGDPVAVGTNSAKLTTMSGTATDATNKIVDTDSVGTSGASKILQLDSSGNLPALDGSNLTGLQPGLDAGIVTALSTNSAANNDITITTGFEPRRIILDYYLTGVTDDGFGEGSSDNAVRGTAIYDGTTLVYNNVHWTYTSTTLPTTSFAGNNSSASFIIDPTSTTAPTAGNSGANNQSISVTLSIASTSSSGFTIRRVTVIGSGTPTATAAIAYQAYE